MALSRIASVGRTYRHIDRYRQILTVLVRYGFGDLLETLKLDQYLQMGLRLVSPKRRKELESLSRAERVRMALEELGPTFIKMGQILSTRPDLLPVDFLEELQRLQDNVPPFDPDAVRETLEAQLDRPVEEVFDSFDDVPLASASLGQVHRAKLADGTDVVVKLQRPGIRRTIDVDLEILTHLAGLLERHVEGLDVHRPTRIVDEFARTLNRELDYRLEAAHIERFATLFTGDPTIHVPEVYRDWSTSRVLTLEYVDGVKPTELQRLKDAGLDPRVIAHRGAELLMKQVFVHGFFHADPHPGNIFILPGNVVCFLDFGMMGRIGRSARESFADLIMGLVDRDPDRCATALLDLTERDREPNRTELVADLSEFIDQHVTRTLGELELGRLLLSAMDAVRRHQLRVPPNLFLTLKALATVEGLGRRLDPGFDVSAEAAPFLRRIYLARFDPRRLASDMADTGGELFRLFREIPGEIRELIRQARAGRLKLEFELRGLEPLTGALDRVSNRLAFAVVLASLVIGSALIVLSGLPPKWGEIPIIGLAGFVVAGLMGFWLLISILRHGRM